MLNKKLLLIGLGLALLPFVGATQTLKEVDILIKNALVYDGMNNPPERVAVGVSGEKIAYIGERHEQLTAKYTIDAKGAVLSPGFIDPHTHADRWLKDPGRKDVLPWVKQGVTTLFAGNDGFGPYDVQSTFEKIEKGGMGANLALFVGFGTIRTKVLGKGDVQPTEKQMEEMKKLVKKGMNEGAIGFSTGLLYVPQRYSKTEEVIELSKTAAEYGAIYDSHIRSETGRMLESVEEVLHIGKEANIPLHISHIKTAGARNWGKSEKAIKIINKARAKGVNITANQYPFIASLTSMKTNLIPGWAQAGGNNKMLERFEDEVDLKRIKKHLQKRSDEANKKVMLSSRDAAFDYLNGKTLYEVCQEWKLPIEETVIKILKMSPAISAISFSMAEEDILNFMKEPWVMTGSDGGGIHPRTFATFSKIIDHYTVREKVLELQQTIYRATGLTAKTFNIKNRGSLKEGNYADLIIFNPENIKTNSTFKDIEHFSDGMSYVLINGKIVIDDGEHTSVRAGKPVLKQ